MFNQNDIKTFEWEGLNDKKLEIYVKTDLSNGIDYTCKTAFGKDVGIYLDRKYEKFIKFLTYGDNYEIQ